MLHIIRYYLFYKYGLLLQTATLLFIFLFTFMIGREAENMVGVTTAGLIYAYCYMFDCFGIYTPKFDSIDTTLPLSFMKLQMAKYFSFLVYLFYILFAFYAYAEIMDKNVTEVMKLTLQALSLIFIMISGFGKIKYLSSKSTFVNIPNAAYLALAVFVTFYMLESTIPDDSMYGSLIKAEDLIQVNIEALVLMLSADFISQYLNRNKIVRA